MTTPDRGPRPTFHCAPHSEPSALRSQSARAKGIEEQRDRGKTRTPPSCLVFVPDPFAPISLGIRIVSESYF